MESRRYPQTNKVTIRSVLLAIVLIPFNGYWILSMSYMKGTDAPTLYACCLM